MAILHSLWDACGVSPDAHERAALSRLMGGPLRLHTRSLEKCMAEVRRCEEAKVAQMLEIVNAKARWGRRGSRLGGDLSCAWVCGQAVRWLAAVHGVCTAMWCHLGTAQAPIQTHSPCAPCGSIDVLDQPSTQHHTHPLSRVPPFPCRQGTH
jgi:hypothetical protein